MMNDCSLIFILCIQQHHWTMIIEHIARSRYSIPPNLRGFTYPFRIQNHVYSELPHEKGAASSRVSLPVHSHPTETRLVYHDREKRKYGQMKTFPNKNALVRTMRLLAIRYLQLRNSYVSWLNLSSEQPPSSTIFFNLWLHPSPPFPFPPLQLSQALHLFQHQLQQLLAPNNLQMLSDFGIFSRKLLNLGLG